MSFIPEYYFVHNLYIDHAVFQNKVPEKGVSMIFWDSEGRGN